MIVSRVICNLALFSLIFLWIFLSSIDCRWRWFVCLRLCAFPVWNVSCVLEVKQFRKQQPGRITEFAGGDETNLHYHHSFIPLPSQWWLLSFPTRVWENKRKTVTGYWFTHPAISTLFRCHSHSMHVSHNPRFAIAYLQANERVMQIFQKCTNAVDVLHIGNLTLWKLFHEIAICRIPVGSLRVLLSKMQQINSIGNHRLDSSRLSNPSKNWIHQPTCQRMQPFHLPLCSAPKNISSLFDRINYFIFVN